MIYQPKIKEYNCRFKQVQVRLEEAPTIYTSKKVNNPQRAIEVLGEITKTFDREHFIVVNLTAKCAVINFNVVSIGGLSNAEAAPANVFKSAILSNAARVLLLHNHPSGNVDPSESDILVTQRLALAGEILGIQVEDHVILANNEYYSMREHNHF